MSLKEFHPFFIFLAALFSMAFAGWVFFSGDEQMEGLVLRLFGAFSALLGVGLAIYGVWFIRKKAPKLFV